MSEASEQPMDPVTREAVRSLAEAALRLLEPMRAAAPFLAGWPEPQPRRAVAPSRLPVLDWLGDVPAGAAPETAALVQDIVAHANRLGWGQTYAADDFGAAFLERYGWSELIGLRGPLPSRSLACGFLLLGPAIEYPAHAHEAEELYVPLSGRAWWKRGDEPWALRKPGTPIHHPAWVAHAMRTAAEPLLALYVWRDGDLAAKATIVGTRQSSMGQS